jgi:hypothetical protein
MHGDVGHLTRIRIDTATTAVVVTITEEQGLSASHDCQRNQAQHHIRRLEAQITEGCRRRRLSRLKET